MSLPAWPAAALLAGVLGFACAAAGAVCLDSKSSVEQEFHDSAIVAIGVATARRDVSAADDPEGIDHTLYQVRLTRVFKGARGAHSRVQLVSENTSGRFAMERGVPYLLFIDRSVDGSFVSNCGWSGELGNRNTRAALRRVEAIAAQASRAGSK